MHRIIRKQKRKPLSLMVLAGLTPLEWEIAIGDENDRGDNPSTKGNNGKTMQVVSKKRMTNNVNWHNLARNSDTGTCGNNPDMAA